MAYDKLLQSNYEKQYVPLRCFLNKRHDGVKRNATGAEAFSAEARKKPASRVRSNEWPFSRCESAAGRPARRRIVAR